jgi:hypothetical protein
MQSTNSDRCLVTITIVAFLGSILLGLSGCAASGSDYTNPGRAQTYDPQETSYEKPWPFGDLGNGH